MEGMQAECCSLGWATMEDIQEECSLGVVAELKKISDAVESMQDQWSLGLVVEVEPANDAVDGRQEECFVRVAADLTKAKDMVKHLEARFAAQQQEGGGGDEAAGGYQRVRALASTICASIDKALHMITSRSSRRADGSRAAGQPGIPGSMPSSGGDGSSRSAVSDQGGGGNAPGQSSNHRKRALPRRSTQVRVSTQGAAFPNDDGFSWRKYGQKDVLGAKYPRCYYRCTHRTQGCTATKQAQRTDGDPLLFDVVYHGVHTCTLAGGAAAHPSNQIVVLPAAEQTSASGSEAGSVLTSEVPGLMVSTKGDMTEEPPSTPYMDVTPSTPYMDVMAWFAIGKLRQKGRLSHTCMQQAGQELLGRDDIRQNIMENILLDSNGVNNCTVICIYGRSGLGKTSLLHVLYNDQQLLDAFDKRIWIQISEKVDMVMFFRKIIEFAMNERCSIKNIDILRELVVEEITDKKFLLILDDADIEDQQFWNSILEVLNAGAKGSVVIMATKSCAVVTPRDVTYAHFLNPLSEDNKLMIFQQYSGVGTDIQNNPDLVMVAKRFISRFGSNPLNLKAIGGLLCHADTISLEKDMFEESVCHDALQLSHAALPVHLKRCLALCSLFPEGYIFDKHHMVLLWISHGCVRPVEGYEPEDVGVEYFNELLCRSFFQCSPVHSDKDDMFVMHELIYNVVATSVSRDEYFKSEDLLSSIPENVLHFSVVCSQFQTVELMHRTEQLKDLQTFLALQPEWKPNNISSLPTLNLVGLGAFFLKFTSLETLDLSHTETEELPGSISGLRNLRYLSVNSTNVRALPPELCSLSNLQTLEAKHCCFLTELPRDSKKLVNLRHLDLVKELGYVDLPRGIGELTELRTLPVFHVSGDSSRCAISELGSLHNLRGCLWLSGLGSVKTGSKAQEANLKDKHRLKDLTLQWHDDGTFIEDEELDQDEDTEDVADAQVLEGLQPHANLKALTIRGYEGSRFPAWMQGSSPSLPNLVTLTLDGCCNCTEFPAAIAHLPSLKSLSVRKMYGVRRLSSNTAEADTTTHGDGSAAKFPWLELLNLWEMYGLEELFLEESQGDCGPRLRKVCISRCPDLKRLPRAPSLTELVLHCGHQLPDDISEMASLVSLKIEGSHGVKSFGLPAAAALRKLEIRSCKELSSVDGLPAALTTVRRIKIAGCPKLVLPGSSM